MPYSLQEMRMERRLHVQTGTLKPVEFFSVQPRLSYRNAARHPVSINSGSILARASPSNAA